MLTILRRAWKRDAASVAIRVLAIQLILAILLIVWLLSVSLPWGVIPGAFLALDSITAAPVVSSLASWLLLSRITEGYEDGDDDEEDDE